MKRKAALLILVEAVLLNAGEVAVCVQPAPANDLMVVASAKEIARKIYHSIGVGIRWQTTNDCSADAIEVEWSLRTPEKEEPGALGYAMPYQGSRIVVYYDRLPRERTTRPSVLGHVLAHEIGHILQGFRGHSETGVMKAAWQLEDLMMMRSMRLSFTRLDATLIHDGLRHRSERLQMIRQQASAAWRL